MLSTGRHAPGAYLSIAHGTKEIYRTEGLYGFYRGLLPSLFGVSHGAIQFMAYEKLKIWRANRLAGEDSEGVTSISTATTSRSVGAGMGTGLKDAASGAKKMGVANMAAPHEETKVELSNWDFLTLSALSKIFAGSITYPYQVVRARLQTYDAPLRYKGATDVVRQVWRREGISGFYKGRVFHLLDHKSIAIRGRKPGRIEDFALTSKLRLGPNVVRVLPSTCVTFLVYENTKIYLPRFYEKETSGDNEATSKHS